ncbi:hypothetical protein QE152_g26407 [Popillia japonica]|uniref:Uncharacterized protein n=1 Tax=Popillia japonica TaxID=7064 RepID=A0AAW1JYV3_POPJA
MEISRIPEFKNPQTVMRVKNLNKRLKKMQSNEKREEEDRNSTCRPNRNRKRPTKRDNYETPKIPQNGTIYRVLKNTETWQLVDKQDAQEIISNCSVVITTTSVLVSFSKQDTALERCNN